MRASEVRKVIRDEASLLNVSGFEKQGRALQLYAETATDAEILRLRQVIMAA